MITIVNVCCILFTLIYIISFIRDMRVINKLERKNNKIISKLYCRENKLIDKPNDPLFANTAKKLLHNIYHAESILRDTNEQIRKNKDEMETFHDLTGKLKYENECLKQSCTDYAKQQKQHIERIKELENKI